MTEESAGHHAREWIDAWNRHDLDAILSHYAEAIDYSSPFIERLTGEPSGRFSVKDTLRLFVAKALARFPELKFELLQTFAGVNSVVLLYRSVTGLAAEVMVFDGEGRIRQVLAHYHTS